MIPGYLATERIVGRVIRVNGDTDVRLCHACDVDFRPEPAATFEDITQSDPLAGEKCDECGEIIGRGGGHEDEDESDEGDLIDFDDAHPERPHDTALIGFRSRQ